MPIIKSAIKRAKQTVQRRERNINIKRNIKNATKIFMAKPAAVSLSKVQSELDKAVKKGLLKKNTVARRKSQLAKVTKNAGVKLAVSKKAVKKTTSKKPATKTTKTPVKKPTVKKTA
jgi:ribosomal protein S20